MIFWENITQNIKGKGPCERFGHASVSLGGVIIYFGGKNLNK